jgi:hypothetical protein
MRSIVVVFYLQNGNKGINERSELPPAEVEVEVKVEVEEDGAEHRAQGSERQPTLPPSLKLRWSNKASVGNAGHACTPKSPLILPSFSSQIRIVPGLLILSLRGNKMQVFLIEHNILMIK